MEGKLPVLLNLEIYWCPGGVAEGVDVLCLHVPLIGEFEEHLLFRVRIERVDIALIEFAGNLCDRDFPLVGEVDRQNHGEYAPEEGGAEPDEIASHGLIQDEARPEARD